MPSSSTHRASRKPSRVAVVTTAMLVAFVAAAAVRSPASYAYGQCTSDDQCVPDGCCHAAQCVDSLAPGYVAPNCSDTVCTLECRPDTLDCGQAYCKCDAGACRAVKATDVWVPTDPAITPGSSTDPTNEPPLPPAQDACDLSVDEDDQCVPATCCHPTQCVRKQFAPNCTGVVCTLECRPGTMDCGQGYCECSARPNADAVCLAKYVAESTTKVDPPANGVPAAVSQSVAAVAMVAATLAVALAGAV